MSHVLVICAQRYNGHELWTALGVMQNRGHTFEVVSTQTIIRDELTLQPNTIARTVYQVALEEVGTTFEGVMVVSGNMPDTEAYWTDKQVLALFHQANSLDLPMAAICCSVPTIRYEAKGKHVSFFPLVRSREALENAGAILCTVALTVDKNLVTAEHQMASQMWAIEFCNMLEGKPAEYNLRDSGYTPKGRERKLKPDVARAMAALRKGTTFKNPDEEV